MIDLLARKIFFRVDQGYFPGLEIAPVGIAPEITINSKGRGEGIDGEKPGYRDTIDFLL